MSDEQKHTPGPWEVDGEDSFSGVRHDGHPVTQWPMYRICSHNQLLSYALGDKTGLGSQEESNANARLIAAAPELLEACEQVKSTMEINGHAERNPHLYEIVSDAIAKAEGKDSAPIEQNTRS